MTFAKGFQIFTYLIIFLTKSTELLTKPLAALGVADSSILGGK